MNSRLERFLVGVSIWALLQPAPLLGGTPEDSHTLAPQSQIQNAHRVAKVKQAARIISRSMIDFYENFRRVTRRAKIRFETQDWEGSVRDTRERLLLYNGAVWDSVRSLKELLGPDATDLDFWKDMKAEYEVLMDGLYEADLGKTFYNRVGRRMFPNHVFEHRFIDDKTTVYPIGQYEDTPIYKKYPLGREAMHTSITEILSDYSFQNDYIMQSDMAKWIARDIQKFMREKWDREPIDAIEMVKTVFYRNKAAYLVGRIRAGNLTLPIIIPLLNTGKGILIDTVVLDDMEASRIFSSTRTNFHIDIDRYREVVAFLETIFPNKNTIFLHKAVGYKALAKRKQLEELFRGLDKPHPLLQKYPELLDLLDVVRTEDGVLAFNQYSGQEPYAKGVANLRNMLQQTESSPSSPVERPSLLTVFQEETPSSQIQEALTTYLGKKAHAERRPRFMAIRRSLTDNSLSSEEQEELGELFSLFSTQAGQDIYSNKLEPAVLGRLASLQTNITSGAPIDEASYPDLIKLIDVIRDRAGQRVMTHYLGSLRTGDALQRFHQAHDGWEISDSPFALTPILEDLLAFASSPEGKDALIGFFGASAYSKLDLTYEEIQEALLDPTTPLQKYPQLLFLLEVFTSTIPHNLADSANIKHLGWKNFGNRKARLTQIRNELRRQDGKAIFTEGIPGTLLTVLTTNELYGIGSEIVLKVIKNDQIISEQSTLRKRLLSSEKIRQSYYLVNTMDRVGRLLEPSTYENISFPINAFNPYVLKELLEECSERVFMQGDRLIIKHLYAMRKVTPLDVWLKNNREDPKAIRQVLKDLGHCIKDCAAQNLFLKDSTLRNFGVASDGRVVIYDYDSLQLITHSEIREKKVLDKDLRKFFDQDEDPDVRLENHIFPSDLSNLLGNEIPKEHKPFFKRLHGEIFEEDYWRSVQNRLQAGEVLDFFPYNPEERFINRHPQLAAMINGIEAETTTPPSMPVTEPSYERWEELETLRRDTAAQTPKIFEEALETLTTSAL